MPRRSFGSCRLGRRTCWSIGVATILPALLVINAASASIGVTERVSVSATGEEANGSSSCSADDVTGDLRTMSYDGTRVAFTSSATNLSSTPNPHYGAFVRDLTTGATTKVDVSSHGEPADTGSASPTISGDGGVVAFTSLATNLSPLTTSHLWRVYAHSVSAGWTRLLSVSADGTEARSASGPSASFDGSKVAFESDAEDLVAGDTNGQRDVFVRDLRTGTTTLVSVSRSGGPANGGSTFASISADGRYVAFESSARNLARGDRSGIGGVFVRDLVKGVTERVSISDSGEPDYGYWPSISADGRYVAFRSVSHDVEGDTNDRFDIFVRDRVAERTYWASVASDGTEDIGGDTVDGTISPDGRAVTFTSSAPDLVRHDTNGTYDVFVHFLDTGVTLRASVATDGTQAHRASIACGLSNGGRTVAFSSSDPGLVPDDTNDITDVFVHDFGS